jgi:hypothetical protein
VGETLWTPEALVLLPDDDDDDDDEDDEDEDDALVLLPEVSDDMVRGKVGDQSGVGAPCQQ